MLLAKQLIFERRTKSMSFVLVSFFLGMAVLAKVAVANTSKVQPETIEFPLIRNNRNYEATINKPNFHLLLFKGKNVAQESGESFEYDSMVVAAKAAHGFLAKYGMDIAIVDCKSLDIEKCSEEEGKNAFGSIYKDGRYLVSYKASSLFNEDALISNCASILLIYDVNILLSEEEVLNAAKEAKEKNLPLIVGYFLKIGTPDHRAFVESVFELKKSYKFVTTDVSDAVKSLPLFRKHRNNQLWMLDCSETTEVKAFDQCEITYFRGRFEHRYITQFLSTKFYPVAQISQGSDVLAEQKTHRVKLFCTDMTALGAGLLQSLLQRIFRNILEFVIVKHDKFTPEEKNNFGFQANMRDFQLHLTLVDGRTVLKMGVKSEKHFELIIEKIADELEHWAGMAYGSESFKDEIYEPGPNGELPEYVKQAVEEKGFGSVAARVEEEDDETAFEVERWASIERSLSFAGMPKLTSHNFRATVEKATPTIVFFYMKYDPRNKWTLWQTDNITRDYPTETTPFRSLDCFDWTDTCSKEGVIDFPSIRVYRAGEKPINYTGFISDKHMSRLARLAKFTSVIELKSGADVDNYIDGRFPLEFNRIFDAQIVGVFPNADSQWFEAAYADMYPIIPFAKVEGDLANEVIKEEKLHAGLSLVYPNNAKPAHYTGKQDIDELYRFISNNYYSYFPELNEYSFPALFARQLPLCVVVCEVEQCSHRRHLSEIARSGNTQYVFSWLDINSLNTESILEELSHGRYIALPEVFVVDYQAESVYFYHNTEGSKENPDVTYEELEKWLKDVSEGKMEKSNELLNREFRPSGPFYDFTELIDVYGTGQDDPHTDDAESRLAARDHKSQAARESHEMDEEQANEVTPETPNDNAQQIKHTEL